MDLELRHLRILLAISEAGSLTRAAAALFLSQPAMTTQLRRIEASFGQPLFERSACGVAPTRAGELVLAHARTAVASADRIRSYRLRPVDGAEPVTVGGSSGPILSHLTLHLPAAVTNPVTFVQFSSTGDAMNGVEDRSVDAGCMVDLDGFGATPSEGVVVDVIGLEPVVVILPAGHPAPGRIGSTSRTSPTRPGCCRRTIRAATTTGPWPTPVLRPDSLPGCHPTGSETSASSATWSPRASASLWRRGRPGHVRA